MTTRHHTIDYVELAAPDLNAAQTFYAEVFGWSFNDYGPGYAGIRSPDGDGEVGGLDPHATAGSGSPLVILYSEDLPRTEARCARPADASPGIRSTSRAVAGSTSSTREATSWASLPPDRP